MPLLILLGLVGLAAYLGARSGWVKGAPTSLPSVPATPPTSQDGVSSAMAGEPESYVMHWVWDFGNPSWDLVTSEWWPTSQALNLLVITGQGGGGLSVSYSFVAVFDGGTQTWTFARNW
jgi:hypothetical protein